jgi:lipopolysaccharide heptosyltransferase I
VKRILVLRLSALGDVIHTIPAVAALRDAHVWWVVEAPYAELVEIVAGVEAIPVRVKKWARSMVSSRHEIHEALGRMRAADTSIDFQGLMKSAMIGALARARTRIGFDKPRERASRLFTNQRVAVDTTKHVIEQNLELACSVGVSPTSGGRPGGPHYTWSAFPQPLDVRPGKTVILPGAGKPSKLWPIDRFRELAGRVDDPLVVWGPGEAERAQAIGARVAPPTNLRELAWLLQNAELVIGGDTGPLHLAAALGTKVVGLYGPTDPRRNGPYGQLDHVVDEFVTTKLMESITVEAVMKAVERVSAE